MVMNTYRWILEVVRRPDQAKGMQKTFIKPIRGQRKLRFKLLR
jgi:hypothetical protein